MLTQWLCSQLEMPFNLYLQTLDAKSLDKLNDTVLALHFTGLEIQVVCHFQGGAVNVMPHYDSTPTLAIHGTPLAFCRLGLDEARTLAMGGDLQFEGDITKAQLIVDALTQMDLNWTLWMRSLLGDQFTHVVDEALTHTQETLSHIHQSLSRNVTEYLQEEIRLLPPREALNDFFDDVDALMLAVERLEKRIERCEQDNAGDTR